MNAASGHLASISDIAAALVTQLEAVMLADDATPAFQRIELFDSENLLDAFALLSISEKRICLVVPLTETFEEEKKQAKLFVRRSISVTLLISDRVIGDRTAALFGNAQTPGAFALAARALPWVTGQLIANPAGVISVPQNSDVIIVKNEKEKQNLPGRAAVALELKCSGGWIEAGLGLGPTL